MRGTLHILVLRTAHELDDTKYSRTLRTYLILSSRCSFFACLFFLSICLFVRLFARLFLLLVFVFAFVRAPGICVWFALGVLLLCFVLLLNLFCLRVAHCLLLHAAGENNSCGAGACVDQ